MSKLSGHQNGLVELVFNAEEDFDCVFVDPEGRELSVPAFWSGRNEWRVRYASPHIGVHQYRAPDDVGDVEVVPYTGDNPLFAHGPLRVSDDGGRLAHADGTPFLWLADTWWFGFIERLEWPDDFQRLTADRVSKGFSVIQLIAGLYGEVPAFDKRGGDEWPWEADFAKLNLRWWDAAESKLAWLVYRGLVPCVVGAWGYFLDMAGPEVMRAHWRNLIARFGAFPVVWCLAGETKHVYYDAMFTDQSEEISRLLGVGWAEMARFVRKTDPYERVLTTHPSPGDGSWSSYDVFPDDPDLYDLNILHTGHWDRSSFPKSLEVLRTEVARTPRKPVLNSEICYEGIMGSNWQDTQRFLFWSHLLSGAAGHTYGAQGLWGMNDGTWVGDAGSWSDTTWEEAYRLPGSGQVGLGRRLLERYPWWEFEPHPEWVETQPPASNLVLRHAFVPSASGDPLLAYAAGTDDVRVIYFPSPMLAPELNALRVVRIKELPPGSTWDAHYVNPRQGEELETWQLVADDGGDATIDGGLLTVNPSMEDWVLVLERRQA
jgi:hypothetical protein